MDSVELERVHGSVSAPILDGAAPDSEDLPAPETLSTDLPWPALRQGSIQPLGWAAPLLAGSAIVFATGDPSLGAGWAALVGAAWLLRSVSMSVSFSFGEGFLGYRPDPGRPQGVQEDDDFRWDWRPREGAADDDAGPVLIERGSAG